MEDTTEQFEVGDAVQRLFKYKHPIDRCEGERMWVVITEVRPEGILFGYLDNDPLNIDSIKAGDVVEFHSKEALDVIPASDYAKRCEENGPLPGQLSMLDDELGSRRSTNTQREALDDMAKAIMGAEHVQDFGRWASENLPAQEFNKHSHSVIGGMLGLTIDTWLLAGASPELLKEYLTRFVDMQVEQRKMAAKLFPQPPCDH